MKMCVYIDSMSPAGGIERVVSKHLQFFSKNSEVTLLTKDDLDSFYKLPTNIAIHSMSLPKCVNMDDNKTKRIAQTIKQLATTRTWLKSYFRDFDIIYCTHIRNLLELYIAGTDMKKVIVTEHGSYFGYNHIYKMIKNYIYPKCKYIVAPTTMDHEIYKSKNYNAIYIPNPLSFYNDNKAKLLTKTVINIGRLTKDKQQHKLLAIWRKISVKHPDWNLLIVGKGEEEAHLKKLISDYKLSKTVTIIGPIKNIETFFLNSSIFALTSSFEGFGMVIAEAMSCGVPSISFNCKSGPRDIIENNIDGYLINEGDLHSYITKLDLLMSDQVLRIKMGSTAKENIKKFLDTKIEERWQDLLFNGKPT